MLEGLRNNGLTILNPVAPAPAQRTVMVAGLARSGTTMVATVLSKLGIHMGDVIVDDVYEDIEMARAIRRRKGAVKKLAAQRDAVHRIWGFKRPEAIGLLRDAERVLTNPCAVVVFRDPLAISLREEISMSASLLPQMASSVERTADLVRAVSESTIPLLLVSYEKAMTEPAAFVDAVIAFLELEIPGERRAAAVASMVNGPAKYLESSRKVTAD
jgi:hypothetical protein